MGEALETGKAQDLRPRESGLGTNASAHHQEDREQRQHPQNGDAADDRQLAAVEVAPVTTGGLNEIGGIGVGDGYPPRDLVALFQRVQELVFLHGLGGGLEGQLRRSRLRHHKQQRKRGT